MQRHFLFSFLALAACQQVSEPLVTTPAAPGFTNAPGRTEWLLQRWRDEHGRLPTAADLAAARAQFRAVDANADLLDDPNVQRTSWVSRGADNVGGRARPIVIHPTRPWRIWCGAASGGVWRSDTYGSNWQPLADAMGNLAIASLVLSPADPNVLYAGTGEVFSGDAVAGAGIWKSLDGGDTWSLLTATAAFGSVTRLAISPANASIVLAATTTGVHRSTNGGTTWSTVIASVNAWQVLFSPNHGDRCIAAMTDGTAASVRYSFDSGATWTTTTYARTNGRCELAYAKATSNRLFAAAQEAGGELWRSNDGGLTWTQMAAVGLTGAGEQIDYNNCIWVDPTDSNRIVVGWVSLYRSIDGGATFSVIAPGGGYVIDEDPPHSDFHSIVADPGYNGTTNKLVYVSNDGGIYRTSDILSVSSTAGWSRRRDTLRTTQFYGVAGHGNGKLAGGTQDNGTFAVTRTDPHARRLTGGDGGPCVIDPVEPDRVWTQTQYRNVWRHNGVVESHIGNGLEEADGTCTSFIAPLELDPNDRRRLYSAGCTLWRTVDSTAASVTWVAVKPSTGTAISAIAIAPSNSDIVWVGDGNGAVYRTANATAATPTWVTIDDGANVGTLPNRFVSDIVIHHTDPRQAWVVFGGFTADNVQRTTDNGASWTSRQGSGATALPNAPMLTIAQHPYLPDTFYVGSEVGVFDTQDGGATWSTTNEGPADVRCADLKFIPGTSTLLLGSYGRGLWTADLTAPGTRDIGAGCAGSNGTPVLAATAPRLGLNSTLTLTGRVANQPVWLLQGSSRFTWLGNLLPFEMTPLGAAGCRLRVAPELIRDWSVSGSGTLQLSLPIGSSPALLGQQFWLQAAVADPGRNAFGHVFSNGIEMTIGS